MTENRTPLIQKADGTLVPFSREKLLTSLRRAGARPDQADRVADEIERTIVGGETTGTIYRRAFENLKDIHKGVAARYTLRRALAELGPSGFPFEYFISALFTAQGFESDSGIYLHGKCVEHEVDLVAKNPERILVGELKFHNRSEMKSDLKVALYVHSRFQDIKEGGFIDLNPGNRRVENWLITNTKFTTNVIKYAACNDIHLLGWNYPGKDNLQDMIEKLGLEPLTILTSLTIQEKQSLMHEGQVLCKLLTHDSLKNSSFIPKDKIPHVLEEVELICG